MMLITHALVLFAVPYAYGKPTRVYQERFHTGLHVVHATVMSLIEEKKEGDVCAKVPVPMSSVSGTDSEDISAQPPLFFF